MKVTDTKKNSKWEKKISKKFSQTGRRALKESRIFFKLTFSLATHYTTRLIVCFTLFFLGFYYTPACTYQLLYVHYRLWHVCIVSGVLGLVKQSESWRNITSTVESQTFKKSRTIVFTQSECRTTVAVPLCAEENKLDSTSTTHSFSIYYKLKVLRIFLCIDCWNDDENGGYNYELTVCIDKRLKKWVWRATMPPKKG
jgi:hypothetical protein